MTLQNIASELQARNLVTPWRELDPTAIVCEPKNSWLEIAQIASTLGGGQWRAMDYGAFNKCGTKSQWLMCPEQAVKVINAREVSQELTGAAHGFSVASNASNCLKWAVAPVPEKPELQTLMLGRKFGHHECRPGKFKGMEMLDINSCYAQLLARLPSLRFVWLDKNKFIPLSQTKDEKAKLRDVLARLEVEEDMRRAMWGAALGSTKGGSIWVAGVEKGGHPYWGCYPTAALLVARMALELCQEGGGEVGSKYTQTDCALVKAGTRVPFWDNRGIKYRAKAAGDAHVLGQHRLRVGGWQTEWYRPRDEFYQPTPRPIPFPELLVNLYLT